MAKFKTGISIAALGMVCGCGNIQTPSAIILPGSHVDAVKGRLIDTIDTAAIDYNSQSKARLALTEKKDVKERYPGEMHIGPVDHNRLTKSQTVVYDPQVETFMQEIIRRLLEHWHGKKVDIRIAFVVDSQEAPFEAESGNDGTMYFGLSAIRDVESTDELAFIVSHELAHVLMNHTVRAEQEDQAKLAGESAWLAAVMANNQAAGNNAAALQHASVTNTKLTYLMAAAATVMDDVLSPAFSREQEREADFLGADLMIQAGYSPRAVNYVMQRLQDQDRKLAEMTKALRDAQVAAKKQEEARQAAAKGQKQIVSSTDITAAISGSIDDVFGRIKARHPSAEDREKDVVEYIGREYSLERRTHRGLREEEYQAFKLAVAGGPLMRRQFLLLADDFMKAGRPDDAYTYALRGLANPKDPAPDVRIKLYTIRNAQFDKTKNRKFRTEAVGHLEVAWGGPDATDEVALLLAKAYGTDGKYDNAERTLVAAGKRFGDTPHYLVPRLENYVAAKRKNPAFDLAYQCAQTPNPDKTGDQCRDTLPESWHDDFDAYAAEKEKAKAKKTAAP